MSLINSPLPMQFEFCAHKQFVFHSKYKQGDDWKDKNIDVDKLFFGSLVRLFVVRWYYVFPYTFIRLMSTCHAVPQIGQ